MEWEDKAFVFQAWLLILGSMAVLTGALLSMQEDYPIAIVMAIYFPLQLFYHYMNLARLKISYGTFDGFFCGGPRMIECQSYSLLCPFLFLYQDRCWRCKGKCEEFSKKHIVWIFLLKLASCGSIVAWLVLMKTDAQKGWVITFVVMHTLLAFHDLEFVQIILFDCAILLPVAFLMMVLKIFKDCCCKEQINYQNQNQNQNQQAVVVENQQQNNEGNVVQPEIHRTTTNKAMDNIMNNWRRTLSFKSKHIAEACCVCLDEFKEQEQVIELKCGENHIFHPDCLKSWAERNHSCPLCRKDFVNVAKSMPEKEQEEIKLDVIANESEALDEFERVGITHSLPVARVELADSSEIPNEFESESSFSNNEASSFDPEYLPEAPVIQIVAPANADSVIEISEAREDSEPSHEYINSGMLQSYNESEAEPSPAPIMASLQIHPSDVNFSSQAESVDDPSSVVDEEDIVLEPTSEISESRQQSSSM